MSSFVVDLWESVFVPGPTPTLLRAANGTFALLQLLLLVLLAATRSAHFVALSVLCAGLWWAINWFAVELAAAQRQQEEKEEESRARAAGEGPPAALEDSDTEVDEAPRDEIVGGRPPKRVPDVEPLEQEGELRRRGEASPGGTQSSASTEDEWEKVSESEDRDKDK